MRLATRHGSCCVNWCFPPVRASLFMKKLSCYILKATSLQRDQIVDTHECCTAHTPICCIASHCGSRKLNKKCASCAHPYTTRPLRQ